MEIPWLLVLLCSNVFKFTLNKLNNNSFFELTELILRLSRLKLFELTERW